jgi:hypothetical protein
MQELIKAAFTRALTDLTKEGEEGEANEPA